MYIEGILGPKKATTTKAKQGDEEKQRKEAPTHCSAPPNHLVA
jgi:hypothetical protein